MKIVQVLLSLDVATGGTVRAVLDLSAALTRAGHAVRVLATDMAAGQAADADFNQGTDSVQLASWRSPLGPVLSSDGLRTLRLQLGWADVVHVHGVWEHALAQSLRMAVSLGKPYVISPHGMLDQWPMSRGRVKKRIYYRCVLDSLFRRAAAIHVASSAEALQSGRWYPRHLATVIPNVLDLAPFVQLPDRAEARPLMADLDAGQTPILFLSRLDAKKGLDTLIRALAILRSRRHDVVLIVAGGGNDAYQRRLRALAAELGVAATQLRFVGMVRGSQKLALIRSCALLALPTRHENFGFVLVEALACGTPVLTTTAAGVAADMAQSQGVTIVAPKAADFADAIASLLADRPVLQQRGSKAREWVLQNLKPQAMIRQYEQLYQRCLASPLD